MKKLESGANQFIAQINGSITEDLSKTSVTSTKNTDPFEFGGLIISIISIMILCHSQMEDKKASNLQSLKP